MRCHFVPIKRLFSWLSRLSPAHIRPRIPSIFSICCYDANQNEPLVLMIHQVSAKYSRKMIGLFFGAAIKRNW